MSYVWQEEGNRTSRTQNQRGNLRSSQRRFSVVRCESINIICSTPRVKCTSRLTSSRHQCPQGQRGGNRYRVITREYRDGWKFVKKKFPSFRPVRNRTLPHVERRLWWQLLYLFNLHHLVWKTGVYLVSGVVSRQMNYTLIVGSKYSEMTLI